MCPRMGLDVLEKRKTACSYQDWNAGPFSLQPNRYTDQDTPALIIHGMVFKLSAPFAIVSPLFHNPMCHFFLWFSFLYCTLQKFSSIAQFYDLWTANS